MLAWTPFRRAAIVALAIVGVAAAASPNPLGEVQHVSQVQQRLLTVEHATASDPRIAVWREVPAMARDRPLFGTGIANFSEVAPIYGLTGLAGTSTFDHAHNIALTFLVELGVIGLVAIAWIAVALVRVLIRAWRASAGLQRGLVCALAAALGGAALQGLVDYTMRANVIAALLFALCGCAVVLARAAEQPAEQPPPSASAGH
jgi:O-antigen ligase